MEVLEATIPITELSEDNLIVLDNFPAPVDNGLKVEGRIKYLGFDWSPWVSSQSKVSLHFTLEEQSSLFYCSRFQRSSSRKSMESSCP